jgi:hypothetical protein
MSRYDGLTPHLLAKTEPVVILTFVELDAIVGVLPASARKYPEWWSNSYKSQPHAFAWLDASRLANPDFVEGQVTFTLGSPSSGRGPTRQRSTPRQHRPLAKLMPTGGIVEVSLAYEWHHAGGISLELKSLAMPKLGETPGIYRFTLADRDGIHESYYVGESDNLSRRMAGYRNPGPTQHTNVRMHERLRSILGASGSASVAVVVSATCSGEELDLSSKSARLLIESAALVDLAAKGVAVENL